MIKEKVSVLILAHNEEKTIKKEILLIQNSLKKKFNNFEIIISEDGSKDNTIKEIRSLKKKLNLIICTSKKRKGYAKAFIDGVKKCKSKTIFFSDTGKKYNYREFYNFYLFFKKENLDLCCGERYERKDKFIRQILTFFYTLFLKVLFFKNYNDFDCGFRIYKKEKLFFIINKYSFHPMLIGSQIFMLFIKHNYKIAQKKIQYLENNKRKSRGIPNHKIFFTIVSSIIFSFKIRFLNI